MIKQHRHPERSGRQFLAGPIATKRVFLMGVAENDCTALTALRSRRIANPSQLK
jgi:hypothetical protein